MSDKDIDLTISIYLLGMAILATGHVAGLVILGAGALWHIVCALAECF